MKPYAQLQSVFFDLIRTVMDLDSAKLIDPKIMYCVEAEIQDKHYDLARCLQQEIENTVVKYE